MGTRTQNEQVADQINGDEPDFTGMNFSQFVANRSRLIRGTAGDQGIFG
jgi:hypothetical protein